MSRIKAVYVVFMNGTCCSVWYQIYDVYFIDHKTILILFSAITNQPAADSGLYYIVAAVYQIITVVSDQ